MALSLSHLRLTALLASLLSFSSALSAQAPARFDLAGPKVEVRVTRGGKTLPIAAVPNLQPGDKLWLHPDLPPTQSVHYLLVAVFLRGTTNPPPDNWFIKIPTWTKSVRDEGVEVTVPDEAQQAILLLAPETGGDFSTLRSAVRGRPGIFVRASQDLAEAGFEQARIEMYLASMRQVPPADARALLDHSNLLARTLNLRPNEECFKRSVDLQYNCLTQSGNQTLLDDGHGQTIVATLTTGASSDLIAAASYTQLAGGGVYSAYVGAIVDLARLMGGLHTAHYQYIPAIAFPQDVALNLRLNTAPSFHNPKSVIVIGLPAIQTAIPPPLRQADPKFVTCLLKPSVVLPVEGAPLVFSTSFAHNLILHIDGTEASKDIPLVPDAFQGGLVLAPIKPRKLLPFEPEPSPAPSTTSTAPIPPPQPISTHAGTVTGTISGYWGFDAFHGPALSLQQTPGTNWKLASDSDPNSILIAGNDNHLSLSSTGTACIDTIALELDGKALGSTQRNAQWKQSDKPNHVDLKISLKSLPPGDTHFIVRQFGKSQPDTVAAKTFSEPATLSALTLHAGDTTAVLTGTSLDEVQQLTLNKLVFTPNPVPPGEAAPEKSIRLSLPFGSDAPPFHPGDKLTAQCTLKDGRTLTLPMAIAPPRPAITLISKRITSPTPSPIHLANEDDLPVTQQLTFSLKSSTPFPRTGQLEITNSDDTLHTTLSVANGTLVLQNPRTLLATLDPLKTFGTSAFGPLRLRPVSPDGTPGDWLALATLVRLPTLNELHCPTDITQPCTLSGTNLYLVEAIAPDAAFTTPTTVPEGFIGTTLTLPRPPKSGFYLRLRDDPNTPHPVTLPILPPQ